MKNFCIRFRFNLSNYAAKSDLENATGVDG